MAEYERTHGTRGSRQLAGRRVIALCSILALIIAAIGLTSVTADAAGTGTTAAAQRPRPPRPTTTPQPTTTPAPTASPTASPSPTTSPSACQSAVVFEGASYCPGHVNLVTSTAYGVGQRIVVDVVVDRVSGSRVDVHGAFWCPPGKYCGALFAYLSVTFAPGATVPAYGNMMRLFGVTTPGGLNPTGFAVTGQCEPAWGDC